MKKIVFFKEHLTETFEYSNKPVITIIRSNFLTTNKNWVNQLITSSILIKFTAFNQNNEELSSYQTPLSLGAYITPYHSQPVLKINQTFTFDNKSSFHDLNNCKWSIEIILNNLELNKDESLTLEFMDSSYIQKRVDDWKYRVNNLIENIKEWASDDVNISISAGRKVKMHEGLMKDFNIQMNEIETIDIKKGGKTIIIFKPYGLWVMGANGRIDLLTSSGNNILIDEAKSFEPPKWKLYLNKSNQEGIDFNTNNFHKLLDE